MRTYNFIKTLFIQPYYFIKI